MNVFWKYVRNLRRRIKISTIKFDDYLEKRSKKSKFKPSFEAEDAKLNIALSLIKARETASLIILV